MSARVLFEVAIRIIGLWFLVDSLASCITNLAVLIDMSPLADNTTIARTGIWYLTQCALGFLLVCWAPAIAKRFYPLDVERSDSQIRVGRGDIYHIACFILGVYLLVGGIESAGTYAITSLLYGWTGVTGSVPYVVAATVNTAAGLLLIFGARQLGAFLSKLVYDPQSIPQQQFSLKLLLIITGVVAVILGVIRMVTVSD